jgi:transposase-like protein
MPPSETNSPMPRYCPFCQSSAVAATGQKISESTYFRCSTCGQLWNPARLQLRPNYGRQR